MSDIFSLQSLAFVELLGVEARSEHQDHEEQAASAMQDVGQEGLPADLPRGELHAAASEFSDAGRTTWYIKLVKLFDLAPRTTKTSKTAAAATNKKRKGRTSTTTDQAGSPAKKSRNAVVDVDDDDDEVEEDDEE